MAAPKKGTLYQKVLVMVDKTDFATVESALGTDSDFNSKATKLVYGYNQGVSTLATSAAISKLIRQVHSGLWQVTLNATETNFDRVVGAIAHPSCALAVFDETFVDNDDSDIMSRLVVIASAASDAASGIVALSALVSDVYSQLSDIGSDLRSLIVTTGANLNTSVMSDLRSAIAAGPAATITDSDISNVASAVADILASRLSDTLSAAQQTNSRVLLLVSTASDLYSQLSDFRSDIHSFMSTTGVGLNASTMSDLRSAISGGPTNALTTSDISDIASAVKVILASDMSDTLSAARQINSRVLLIESQTSDTQSYLVALSAAISDLESAMDSQFAASPTASDVASIVIVATASTLSDIQSYLAGMSASISDLYSQVSDFRSDLHSHVSTTGVQVNASAMSDLRSAVTAAVGDASLLSDILSAAQQANSRVLVVQSLTSDVQSNLTIVRSLASDAHSAAAQAGSQAVLLISSLSDVQSYLVAMSGMLSDAHSAALAAQSLASDAASAATAIKAVTDNMARASNTIVLGTVGAAATTTSIPTSALDPAASANDQFNGRVMIFDRNTTTAALRGQATDISDFTSGGTFTVTALTTAPAAGDTFVVV